MDKTVADVAEAVADIRDGAVILVGGFGNTGTPLNLINALVEQGAKNLTIVCNDSSGYWPIVKAGRVRKVISGFNTSYARPEVGEAMARLVDGYY